MKTEKKKPVHDKAKSAVVTVGDGRGFVLEHAGNRLVVTAAHCLPFLPSCLNPYNYQEATYRRLLAPLGGKPAVWAECLFANPVADIAILGCPDNQQLWDQAKAYEALVESAEPIAITHAPREGRGWLLSLQGKWFRCTVDYTGDGPLWVSESEQPIPGGMSGSPIISDKGAAMGIVNLGAVNLVTAEGKHSSSPLPNCRLARDLPVWLASTIT